MARYDHKCPTHGVFEIVRKMIDAEWEVPCPACGTLSTRVVYPVPDTWNCDGSFKHDHINDGRPGDKLERLNKQWVDAGWGDPPPPAPEVPRNSSEKH
jgi:putative FmdB family regulatory protein